MSERNTNGGIEVIGLTRRFADGNVGLDSVCLQLPMDELVVVTGCNGAGKSLLARHLVGLERPSSGRIMLEAIDIQALDDGLPAHVAYVFQDAEHQIIGQTVREDLAFGPSHRGLPYPEIERRVQQMLELFSLTAHADSDPQTLSGGELRRLAVAGVVISGARYVILDEPFSSLDPPGVREVLRSILALRVRGCGVMVITHELEKVLAHADRLVIMDRGQVRADGPPSRIAGLLPRFGLRTPSGTLAEMTWLE